MCQKLKTREEISTQAYLTKADTSKLLQVSREKASRIYCFARAKDDEELKYIIEPTKVRLTSVCKVIGMTVKTVQALAIANKKDTSATV